MGGVRGEDGAEVWDVVGYADAAGDEHDCAVGGERGGVDVGDFDEGAEGEAGGWCG